MWEVAKQELPWNDSDTKFSWQITDNVAKVGRDSYAFDVVRELGSLYRPNTAQTPYSTS